MKNQIFILKPIMLRIIKQFWKIMTFAEYTKTLTSAFALCQLPSRLRIFTRRMKHKRLPLMIHSSLCLRNTPLKKRLCSSFVDPVSYSLFFFSTSSREPREKINWPRPVNLKYEFSISLFRIIQAYNSLSSTHPSSETECK